MGLVSRLAMESVAAVLSSTAGLPIAEVVARAGCGNIRTVRSAISQLKEEGRIITGGTHNNPLYRLAVVEREHAA